LTFFLPITLSQRLDAGGLGCPGSGLRNRNFKKKNVVPTVYETCEANDLEIDDLERLFPQGYHRGAVIIIFETRHAGATFTVTGSGGSVHKFSGESKNTVCRDFSQEMESNIPTSDCE
jgi:hypothetical protein